MNKIIVGSIALSSLLLLSVTGCGSTSSQTSAVSAYTAISSTGSWSATNHRNVPIILENAKMPNGTTFGNFYLNWYNQVYANSGQATINVFNADNNDMVVVVNLYTSPGPWQILSMTLKGKQFSYNINKSGNTWKVIPGNKVSKLLADNNAGEVSSVMDFLTGVSQGQ